MRVLLPLDLALRKLVGYCLIIGAYLNNVRFLRLKYARIGSGLQASLATLVSSVEILGVAFQLGELRPFAVKNVQIEGSLMHEGLLLFALLVEKDEAILD